VRLNWFGLILRCRKQYLCHPENGGSTFFCNVASFNHHALKKPKGRSLSAERPPWNPENKHVMVWNWWPIFEKLHFPQFSAFLYATFHHQGTRSIFLKGLYWSDSLYKINKGMSQTPSAYVPPSRWGLVADIEGGT
jgi:hypothetical protein